MRHGIDIALGFYCDLDLTSSHLDFLGEVDASEIASRGRQPLLTINVKLEYSARDVRCIIFLNKYK
jgi:hypothetical protein